MMGRFWRRLTRRVDWQDALDGACRAAMKGATDARALRQFRMVMRAEAGDVTFWDTVATSRSTARSNGWCVLDRAAMRDFMRANPDCAVLFLDDPDGHLREAALRALTRADACPAVAVAVLLRCNDWVPPVRAVALARLRDIAGWMTPEALMPMARLLMGRGQNWVRWDGVEPVLAVETVRQALLLVLLRETSGALVRLCRLAMRHGVFDYAWPWLAVQAQSGAVRAVALEAVLAGKVYWTEGREKVWVDRSMGQYRTRPLWKARELGAVDPLPLLRLGAGDASAAVRRVVADRLCATGPVDGLADVVAGLRGDKSPSVRARIDYYDRAWTER